MSALAKARSKFLAGLRSLGLAYLWGILNFALGTVAGAAMMYLAIASALKAKGIL